MGHSQHPADEHELSSGFQNSRGLSIQSHPDVLLQPPETLVCGLCTLDSSDVICLAALCAVSRGSMELCDRACQVVNGLQPWPCTGVRLRPSACHCPLCCLDEGLAVDSQGPHHILGHPAFP